MSCFPRRFGKNMHKLIDIKRHLGILPQVPHHPTIFVESNLIVQSFFVDSFEEKQEGGLFGVLLTKQGMDHNIKSRDS